MESMEVLNKNKEHWLTSKDKARKHSMCWNIYIRMCQNPPPPKKKKKKKNEDLQSIMSNLQPNFCFKVDFQKWTNLQETIG